MVLNCAVASTALRFSSASSSSSLLLGGYRLVDLLELSLKVDNPLLFLRRILQ
jgi:hypothetical protein